MTSNQFGTFGFLQSGSLDDEPLVLLDFGLEARKMKTMILTTRTETTAAISSSIPCVGAASSPGRDRQEREGRRKI